MGVPSATSAGSQMWVRGPTTHKAQPAAPAAPSKTPAPYRPAVVAQPTSARPASAGRTAPASSTTLPGRTTPAGAAGPYGPAAPAETASGPYQGSAVAWVGAHGGAGTSTLARELGGADVGCRWPDVARGEPGRVLLVARTHAAGMRAASQALDALRKEKHPAGVQLAALVLVADAPGRLPLTLGRRIRVLRSVADVHRLPWIPAWRVGKQAAKPPKEIRVLAEFVAGGSR
jgi:hypothetical protein